MDSAGVRIGSPSIITPTGVRERVLMDVPAPARSRVAVSAVSPAGTQHAGLIGVADAQVGDGEREMGRPFSGRDVACRQELLDDLAAAA